MARSIPVRRSSDALYRAASQSSPQPNLFQRCPAPNGSSGPGRSRPHGSISGWGEQARLIRRVRSVAIGLILVSGSGMARPAQDLARLAPVEWGNWTYALERLEEAQRTLILAAPMEWEAFDAGTANRQATTLALELAAPVEWAAYTAAGDRSVAAEERLAMAAPREKELHDRRQAEADSVAALQAAVEAEMAAMEKVAPIEWAAYQSATVEKVQLEYGALPKAAPAEFKSWSDAKRQHGDAWRSLRQVASVELDEYESARAEARASAEMLQYLFPAGWAAYQRGLDPAILRRIWP